MINFWQIKKYIHHFFTAKRNGHGVHSPFVYALIENVFSNKFLFYDFDDLKKIRNTLLNNETEVIITDMGAGSQKLNSHKRKIKDIVQYGISTKKQSETYFKLINYFKSETMIELGTSVGLNTVYFSKANPKGNIITIEGSERLFAFAKKLFDQELCKNITALNANFDLALPQLFKTLNTFDLLYMDGNHTYEATLRYFKQALDKINADSIIIVDDIYWSNEMTRAWEEIKTNERVKGTIDCFYFGIIFFKSELKQKEHFKLFV